MRRKFLALLIPLLATSACAPRDVVSFDAGIGSLVGAGLGLAGSALTSGRVGRDQYIAAGIGAGAGLLTGAVAHNMNVQEATRNAPVIRKASYDRQWDENQQEIERLRHQVYSESRALSSSKPGAEEFEYVYQGTSR